MKLPAAAREFFKTALQQVCHFKVDVIAGDANAAAYKHCRNQECQDLNNSSVAIMLREMQREVNTGQPLHAAADLGCVLYGWSHMEKGGRAQNHEKTLEQHYHGSFCNLV